MRNKLFYYLCWLTAVTGSLQAQAQNKVVAPMKDVNQVIDNTLDSLNKARTARPIAGKAIIRYYSWSVTPPCVQVHWETETTDNGDGDFMRATTSIRTRSQ